MLAHLKIQSAKWLKGEKKKERNEQIWRGKLRMLECQGK